MPRPKRWHKGHIKLVARCDPHFTAEIDETRQLVIVDACDGGRRPMNRGEFARYAMKRLVEDLRAGILMMEDFQDLVPDEAAVREILDSGVRTRWGDELARFWKAENAEEPVDVKIEDEPGAPDNGRPVEEGDDSDIPIGVHSSH